jgi:hypothetical protein
MRPRGSLLPSSALGELGELVQGDHVICRGGHVGEVMGLRKDASGERFVLTRWFIRPGDTPAGHQPFDGCSELLASDAIDVTPLCFVLCRCRVLPAAEFVRERDAQVARIASVREEECAARCVASGTDHPQMDRLAANPWFQTFGDSPTGDALDLLSVMDRLLRRVQAEVRPDECRRPLQNWLGPPHSTVDKEEHPAPPGSAAERSRVNTLCPRVGTGGSISMLREVFYKPGANGMTGEVLCPRLLNPEGSFALVLDEAALRNDAGFNYSMGQVCPRTLQDSKEVREARAELKNLYCCRRRLPPRQGLPSSRRRRALAASSLTLFLTRDTAWARLQDHAQRRRSTGSRQCVTAP